MPRLTPIEKARAHLITMQPFFGSLALRLKLVESAAVELMAVDGVSIRYNAEACDALSFAELCGVLAHEVLHCANAHHARQSSRDGELWNTACDHAINPLLIEAGFRLPEGALNDPRFHGKAAEEIYMALRNEQQQAAPAPQPQQDQDDDAGDDDQAGGDDDGPGDGAGQPEDGGESEGDTDADAPGDGQGGDKPAPSIGGCGSFSPPPSDQAEPGPAELSEQRREWEIATLQAASIAKATGQLPGFLARLLDDIRAPRVDWREALQRFVSRRDRSDYSWSRPNRRHIAAGLYLPALHSERLGAIVVAIDTSGSIGAEELATFSAELNSVLGDAQPERVHVVYCDAAVAHTDEYGPDDLPVTLAAHGGGGTAFSPVFRWVEDNEIEPECLIYLTDLVCYDFGPEPAYPVLWASTEATAAPFGEVVKIID